MRRAIPLLLLFIFSSLAPAFAQSSVIRIEQNDPAVTYSGNWYSNSSPEHSGGTAALTNTRGSRATLTFNGTGIVWMGVKDNWSGTANVYLDGNMTVVDTYGSNQYQQPMFAAHGLAPGPHTLAIEVLHERGPVTQGSWVWIDSFLIENGSAVPGGVTASAGRIEESNAAILFSGTWYSNASPIHSGGHAALSMNTGSKVTVSFQGTGVSWIGYRDEWSGVANVYVDGVEKTQIDTYLSPSQAQTTLYAITNLTAGAHTLTIEVTGAQNQSSKGSWIWVDAFNIVP